MFGRRTTTEDSDLADATAKADGKGRPTPTRKEAEEARKQRLAAQKGKGSGAVARQRAADQRAKVRAAMQSGDERYLPERDRGPVKKYARDWVDSHRTVGEFLLVVFFLAFVMAIAVQGAYAFAQWAWLAILVIMIADSVRVVRAVKAGVAERFGDDQTKGLAMYTVMRAWQMRRLRLPKPQVNRGDPI